MKSNFLKAIIVVCLVLAEGVASVRADLESKQSHMVQALHFLQDAKKSDKPLPLLKSALDELGKASHNKGGSRVKAIQVIDKAVAEAEAGNLKGMVNKVDAAIALVHDGMSKSS